MTAAALTGHGTLSSGLTTGTILRTWCDVGWVAAPCPSQNEVADATGVATYRLDTVLDPDGSTAGYSDALTLTTTTTLDFFVVDGFLSDNVAA